MPIEDYKKRARIAERRLLEHPDIPEQTKRVIQRFLIAYDVSDARIIIFCQKIKPLLLEFTPIESARTERDRMNRLLADLRARYSPATYATYIGIFRRFLVWLGDGSFPASMVDIKPVKKSDLKRKLKPVDMLTWEDGLLICDVLQDAQLQAAIQLQLDCGFRPSEFIDLTYEDIKVHTGLAVITVQDGKTGGRTVIAQRCVPALLKWLDAHPTKKPGDPLWIMSRSTRKGNDGRLHVKPYRYAAIKKRITGAARKAGIEKPMDFYNLRHSSCVLDKLDNLPVDLASDRHGHSVKYFTGTYGRLSVQDVMRRYNSHYGMAEEEEVQKIIHQTCPVCKKLNPEQSDWCTSCGTPFNTEGAIRIAEKEGIANKGMKDPVHRELEQMKAELAASREREKNVMQEQIVMLKQMQEIRSTLAANIHPSG